MSMKFDWTKVRLLGKGGQGEVWLVRKENEIVESHVERAMKIRSGIDELAFEIYGQQIEATRKLQDAMREICSEEITYGALKILHSSEIARDSAHARDRMARELEAMATLDHPSLLKVLDFDGSQTSYVSQFFQRGTLYEHKLHYQAKPLPALRSVRGLVEAARTIHENEMVHRDIKPQNIFVGDNDRLVLGDFGLVFSQNDEQRLSRTHENVGSRDWMPGWAYSHRVADVKPTFDVFSLGKVIWSMISGKESLPLWYWDNPAHNLVQQFPNDDTMEHVNELLSKCVVEHEEDCLPTAEELLSELDRTIAKLETGNAVVSKEIARKCRVCGTGVYNLTADRNRAEIRNFGLAPTGTNSFRVFVCSDCGHAELFACKESEDLPSAWKD